MRRSVVCGVVLVSLLVSGLPGPATAAAAQDSVDPTPAADQAVVGSRPDRLAALLTAAAQGSRVEVESSRTGSVREWANPDGSFTVDAYTGPNWVQQPGGSWSEVDTTLTADGAGGFTPRASALQVTVGASAAQAKSRLAGGGQRGSAADPAVLARVGGLDRVSAQARESDAVTLGWAGDLPAAQVSGAQATFADVASGVDLRVKVLPSGVETFVDLTKAPSRIPAAGVVVDLPLAAKGLQVARGDSGGVVLTRDGEVVATTPQARIWDAGVDPRSGLSPHEIAVDTELASGPAGPVLRVTVPADYFERAGLTYPVTVDPAVTVQTAGDTFIEKGYNDTNFSGDDDLRVGTYDGGVHKARSYLKFSLADSAPGFFDDTTVVTDAKLHLYQYWSSSCTPSRVDSHRVIDKWYPSSLTWNTRAAYDSTPDGSVTEAHGYSSSCPNAWLNGSTGIDVTDTLQAWAGPDAANRGIVLDAADENDSLSWKRFYSGDHPTSGKRPYVTFTYRHKPGTPSAVTVSPLNSGYTNTATPSGAAAVSDADGGNVRARLRVFNPSGQAVGDPFYSPYRSGNGTTSPVPTPVELVHGSQYTLRSWSDDGTSRSADYLDSAIFTVDTSTPVVTLVSCTDLTSGDWAASAPAGSTCTVNATDTVSGVAASTLTVDGISVAPTAPGANTFTLPPAALTDGYHTLAAEVCDQAGNTSQDHASWYGIGAPAAAITSPVANTRSSRNFPVTATGPQGATGAVLQWAPSGTSTWTTVTPTLSGDGSAWDGSISTTGGVAHTPQLTWTTSADELGMAQGGSIDLRVCFTGYTGGDKCATRTVQIVAHAFGGSFATAPAGPGEVALSTGELQISAVDAALPGANSDIAVGRTWLSMAGAGDSGFGPGWQADLPATVVPGVAAAQVVDRSNIDTSLLLVFPDGSADVFLCTTTTTTCSGAEEYLPVGDTALLGSTLSMSGDGLTLTHIDADAVATTWTRTGTGSTTWSVSGVSDPSISGGAIQPPPGTFTTLTVDGLDVSGDHYGAIVAPTPDGVSDCTWAKTSASFGLDRGCAALTIVTAADTTPVPGSGTVGDYPGRIRAVIDTLWDPDTAAVTSTVVARYGYNSDGMLVTAWDPRDTLTAGPLATGYQYTDGELTSITPASAATGGLTPWTVATTRRGG